MRRVIIAAIAVMVVAIALLFAIWNSASSSRAAISTVPLHSSFVSLSLAATAPSCVSADCGPYAVNLSWSLPTIPNQTGYAIFVNGTQVDDATSSPEALSGIDCGLTLTLGAQAHDNVGNSGRLYTTTYSAPACGPPPTNQTAPTLDNTTPHVGNTVTTTNGTWTGNPGSFTYDWQTCDVSNNCTYVDQGGPNTYTVGPADVGLKLQTIVTAFNTGGDTSQASAQTAAITDASPPTVPTGLVDRQDETDPTTQIDIGWNASTDDVGVDHYNVYRCAGAGCTPTNFVASVNASTLTYLSTGLSAGVSYGLGVTAVDAAGNESAKATIVSVTSAAASPQNTALPAIDNTTPTVGDTLTTTNGTWTNSPTGFSYIWKRCTTSTSCNAISGATSQSYTVVSADAGDQIKVSVTATNGSGSNFATSALTSAVASGANTGSTSAATSVTSTSGTMNGSGSCATSPCLAWFQYSDDNFATISATTQQTVTTGGFTVSQNVTGLTSGHTYQYRLATKGGDLVLHKWDTTGTDGGTNYDSFTTSSSGPVTCPAVSHSITRVLIDTATGNDAHKGMFGPWTNHIVTTSNGDIYAAYLMAANGTDVEGQFRLARSTDGGNTWTYPYTSPDTNWHHIDLETDGTNVYAVVNHENTALATNFEGWLFKFVSGSLGSPTRTKFTSSASSKFSAIYNPVTNQFDVGYWAAFPSTSDANFYAVDTSGNVVNSKVIFHNGTAGDSNGIGMQYSTMENDPQGDIFFGFTTVDAPLESTALNYYDDEMIYSTDNGNTWNGPSGTLSLPEWASPQGNNYAVTNRSDTKEFYPNTSTSYTHNWNLLDSIAYNNGSLNFMYGGDAPASHTSYAHLAFPGNTFSDRTHSWTTQQGTALMDNEQSLGSFSQDANHTGNLYFAGITSTATPIFIYSPNSGTTWCNYTNEGTKLSGSTYLGAARHIDTVNHQVQGIFSHTDSTSTASIYFVKAPVP